MALNPSDIKSQYPLPVYNYRVTILEAGLQGASPIIAASAPVISCSEVSGLNMEIETTTYRHGFSFLTGAHIIPGQNKEVHLSIKKGVTASSNYLSDWIKLVYPVVLPKPLSLSRKRDLLIDLCDEEGKPVVRWKVTKAMPTKLEAPTFDANSNEVAFEQMTFIAHRLEVEYLS